MTEPLEVKKLSYVVPTAVIGADDQGRTLIRCPSCGDDATVMEDGRVSCPTDDAVMAFLRPALERLEDGL